MMNMDRVLFIQNVDSPTAICDSMNIGIVTRMKTLFQATVYHGCRV